MAAARVGMWLRNTTVYYLRGLIRGIDEHNILLMAGGLAFSLFVCAIPLALLVFAVLGRVLEMASVRQQLDLMIEAVIPYESEAAFVEQLVLSRLEEFVIHKNLAGLLGGLGLLVAASGLFSAMRTILNAVYQVTSARGAIFGKLRDMGMITLLLAVFVVTMTIFPALDVLKKVMVSLPYLPAPEMGRIVEVLVSVLALVQTFGIFYVLYRLIPDGRIAGRIAAVSALWAAVMWVIAQEAFGYYIHNFASLGRVYGTYVLFVIVAFWVYYSSLVFILGAQVGALFREAREDTRLVPGTSAS